MTKYIEFSRVAIQNEKNQFLLVYNKKWGRYGFPGGKLEKKETPLQAAKREVFEETNLIIESLREIAEEIFYFDNSRYKGYFYQTNKYSGSLLVKEEEKKSIGGIKFFDKNEVLKIDCKVTKFFLEKLVR